MPFSRRETMRLLATAACAAAAPGIEAAPRPAMLTREIGSTGERLPDPAVTCAIPATSKLDHLRDNMAAGAGPMPHAAMRERIARVTR